MLLRMTEQQFKRWMTAKTRQYIWLILHTDPNRVKISFSKSFDFEHSSLKHSHGISSKSLRLICYRTDYVINGWDCDLEVLEKLIIHEVCHQKYFEHDSQFFTLYKKWSGDDFINRWCKSTERYALHVVGLPDVN